MWPGAGAGAVALLVWALAHAGDTRIIGGQEADVADLPFLTSLQLRGGGHHCVANIVTLRWLLTATHCVCCSAFRDPRDYVVVAGVSNILAARYLREGQRGLPDRFVVHPLFSADSSYDYDLAMVRLREPLVETALVRMVALPMDIVDDVQLYNGTCTVAGWGHTEKEVAAAADAGVAAPGGHRHLRAEAQRERAGVRAPVHARAQHGRLLRRLRGRARLPRRTGGRSLVGQRLRQRVPRRVRTRRHAAGVAAPGDLWRTPKPASTRPVHLLPGRCHYLPDVTTPLWPLVTSQRHVLHSLHADSHLHGEAVNTILFSYASAGV